MKFFKSLSLLFSKSALQSVSAGILMFLAHPSYGIYGLAWIAWIPLFFATKSAPLKQVYWFGLLTGMTVLLGGVPWIYYLARDFVNWPRQLLILAPITYAFITGHVFALILFFFRYFSRKTKVSEILLFPCIYVTIWEFYPMLFRFKMADSQFPFTIALQGIEFTGIMGLEFMMALSNILIYRCLLFLYREKTSSVSLIFAACVISLWMGYGVYSYHQWERKIATWNEKTIGLIQPNRKAHFKRKYPDPGYTYENPWEIVKSKELALKGAVISIWPEGHFYGYTSWRSVRKSFNQAAKEYKTSFLFVDTVREKNEIYNSALWVSPQGKLGGISHKNILVPYGEYFPILDDLPWLQELTGFKFSSVSAGTTTKIFHVDQLGIIPILCYESIFPVYAGKAVGKNGSGKIIAVMSQDGWYGDSFQQVTQHSYMTNMRAIENRVPLIHVINNGPSYVVLPNGRRLEGTPHMKRGAWNIQVPFHPNEGGSFYSHHPNFILNIVRLFTLIICSYIFFVKRKTFHRRKIS